MAEDGPGSGESPITPEASPAVSPATSPGSPPGTSRDTDAGERKRASRRTPAEAATDQRDATQKHLDAQVTRLTAYAASLEAALARHPSSDTAATLTRQLEEVRRKIGSTRPRMPRLRDKTAGTAG